jgi:hypothetical protein
MATMMMAREAWTDERLDDLDKRVDDGFKEIRADFRTLLQLLCGMFATMLIGFLGVIATILTHG